jgi:hypothetical protein
MNSGYLMASHASGSDMMDLRQAQYERVPWRFGVMEDALKSSTHTDIMRLLKVARYRSFKVFRLLRGFPLIWMALLAVWAFLVLWIAPRLASSFESFGVMLSVVILVSAWSILVLVALPGWFGKNPVEWAYSLIVAIIGPVVAQFHLHLFDPIYLEQGRLLPKAELSSLRERVARNSEEARATDRIRNRVEQIDALEKVFTLAGYRIERFPRSRENNPLQIDVDLCATGNSDYCYVVLHMGTLHDRPVDWLIAGPPGH